MFNQDRIYNISTTNFELSIENPDVNYIFTFTLTRTKRNPDPDLSIILKNIVHSNVSEAYQKIIINILNVIGEKLLVNLNKPKKIVITPKQMWDWYKVDLNVDVFFGDDSFEGYLYV